MNLKKLRELAERATPGPWFQDDAFYVMYGPHKEDSILAPTESDAERGECYREEDAAYLAACDPQTILALIEMAEALERVNKALSAYYTSEEYKARWSRLLEER